MTCYRPNFTLGPFYQSCFLGFYNEKKSFYKFKVPLIPFVNYQALHSLHLRYIYLYTHTPWCVDPDDVQMAEIDALVVQPVATGAALGTNPFESRWIARCFRLFR